MDIMTKEFGVGIIGCGNISGAYFKLIPLYRNLKLVACADINPAASKARSAEFGVPAQEIEALLANPAVDVVVNLTIPEAHYPVSKQALEAGKHVYSEKPFVLTLEQGEDLRRIADAKGLKVGSAPDTYLGGSHQFARHLIDSGRIGKVMSGTAHVLGPGMESWHPNPDFFFAPGGGPILDMGPYYVNNLVNLVGPVKRVVALANKARTERTIGIGARKGENVPVVVATNIHAVLEFVSGAQISLMASWDVWAHRHQNMELYGTDGAIFVPDPNFFGGAVEVAGMDREPKPVDVWDHPLTAKNYAFDWGTQANYRGVGLADMMAAVATGGDYRCSLDRSLHTIDVLTAVLRSADEGKAIDIITTCTQPEALGIEEARSLLRDDVGASGVEAAAE
jgi:predicted dehydrogenase